MIVVVLYRAVEMKLIYTCKAQRIVCVAHDKHSPSVSYYYSYLSGGQLAIHINFVWLSNYISWIGSNIYVPK